VTANGTLLKGSKRGLVIGRSPVPLLLGKLGFSFFTCMPEIHFTAPFYFTKNGPLQIYFTYYLETSEIYKLLNHLIVNSTPTVGVKGVNALLSKKSFLIWF